MDILVDVRNVYGQMLVYPVCDKAHLFARIAGSKTLTRKVLCDVEALGYTIHIRTQSWKK